MKQWKRAKRTRLGDSRAREGEYHKVLSINGRKHRGGSYGGSVHSENNDGGP